MSSRADARGASPPAVPPESVHEDLATATTEEADPRGEDDDGHECFDVYTDDGAGNGELVARGYNHERMRTLTLALGEFVEWAPGVGRSPTQEAR